MTAAPTVVQVSGLSVAPLQTVYLAGLLLPILSFLAMNYWVKHGASTQRIKSIIPVHNAAMLWGLTAAAELVVANQQLGLWLVYLRILFSYATVFLFFRFGTVYSGRSLSLSRPINAVVLGGLGIGLVGLVTDPVLGLHIESLVYHTDPFPYYETALGPLWVVGRTVSYLAFGIALYYFLELFATSQYRSSRSLVAYALGMAFALVPSLLTATGQVPTLPGYDHTVFGLGGASIAFFAGAWLGMVNIAPISRDRLLETTNDGLVVLDEAGTIVDYNDRASKFVADTGDGPIGERLETGAPDLPQVFDEWPRSERDASHTVEFSHGGKRYSMLTSTVTDGDTVEGYALLIRDVTERYENRAELERQNEQLDEFANGVAHYLRNPLQVASGQTELATERLASEDPAVEDRLEDLTGALQRMDAIIADLRTMAEQGKSVESTAMVAFGDVARTARSHVDTDLVTLEVASDGTIRADESRVLSILENLVRNSLEHAVTDENGVTVTVCLTDDGFVFEDDGPGIDADLDRLFEYGYTNSSDGTGLGLSIVQTMVESHGWSIRVDQDHDGARFVVSGAVTEPGEIEAAT